MDTQISNSQIFWFVGAAFDTGDQTGRFIKEGIWQNGYQDRYIDLVKSIQPGDRIAIKSSYTRKENLPFDSRGNTVSVMAIKSIGTVKQNHNDGINLDVDWELIDSPREWYFYTNLKTIWKVISGDWKTDDLINFTFENKLQDINRFRNAPFWNERFGDSPKEKRHFKWTVFYEEIADKLLSFKNNRKDLLNAIHSTVSKIKGFSELLDQSSDGTRERIKDICPFTVIGLFNRGITDKNRIILAKGLADFLGVKEEVPTSFEGIPVLNNQKSRFFGFEYDRKPDDIDNLWDFFEKAIHFADSDDSDASSAFNESYDKVIEQFCVGWNITMGLYWIRPWNFLTLDSQSQCYINKKLNIQIGHNGPKRYCNANDYLSILNTLEIRFDEDAYPVHSFPELSLTAWEESSMLQEIEKDINKFKLRYQDFADFINSGNLYIEEERNYKILATQTAAKMIENFNNASESVNIYFQLIELANFFNWRDKDHLNSLKGSDHFVAGINSLITALKNNKLDEAVFESMRSELKKSGIAANMLLQTVLFPFFLVYPDKYFALKSSLLLKCMRRYGYKGFKKGEYIRYNQFTEIQRFASDIKNQLNKYKPKDMIDIQSFLWIAESYDPGEEIVDNNEEEDTENTLEVSTPIITLKPYTIDNIIEEGCFIEKIRLERIFERLRVKKNLILQGPPGTGKTWLAKRLAYVLIGIKNDEKMKAVQFHPNLSYEDFIRGWRPSGEGRLTLIDGPFLEMINASEKDPNTKHVVVIEEINRGNPAQVFGEMLTLLEVDKRTPSEGLELSYRRNDNERVYIPDNLYVIGTMNIADRSLALVDFALRRRFAFINLRPELGSAWSKWVQEKCNIEPDILERIEKRINSLNNDISADTNLGEQFCIGHSFVTPPFEIEIKDPEDWFRQVVDTEIGPLLDEYWFDALEKAEHAKRRLLEGF